MPKEMQPAITDWKSYALEVASTVPEATDDVDMTEVQLGRILSAKSVDEVLTPSSAPSFGETPNSVFTVHGIRRVNGGLNKELGFYLLIDATDENTGERIAYSSGATNIVAQLLWLHQHAEFPKRVKVGHSQSRANPERVTRWLIDPDKF